MASNGGSEDDNVVEKGGVEGGVVSVDPKAKAADVVTPRYDGNGAVVAPVLHDDETVMVSDTKPAATNSTTINDVKGTVPLAPVAAAGAAKETNAVEKNHGKNSVVPKLDVGVQRNMKAANSEVGSSSSGDDSSSSSSSSSSSASPPPAAKERRKPKSGDEAKNRRGDELSGAAKKMLSEAVKLAAANVATSMEQDKRAPKELAFAALFAALRNFFAGGLKALEASAWIRAAWAVSPFAQQTLAALDSRAEWQQVASCGAMALALRQALRWKALTWSEICALVPLSDGARLAERLQMRVEVATACGLMRWTETVLQYTVYTDAHEALSKIDYMRMLMPPLVPTSDEETMRAFSAAMVEIVYRYDMQLPMRTRAASSPAAAVTMPTIRSPTGGRCRNCGLPGHFANSCPTGPVCFVCRLPGHLKHDCKATATTLRGRGRGGRVGYSGRGGGARTVMVAAEDEDENEDLMFPRYIEESFAVHFIENSRVQPLVVSVQVRGGKGGALSTHSMLVDTGAVPSVVSSRFVEAVGLVVGLSRTKSISGVGATKTAVLGEVAFEVELGGVSFGVVALVAETALFDFLLGTRGMRDSNVGTVQINVGVEGGRVRVGNGRWVEATGWSSPFEAHVLRAGPTSWQTPPSVVYAIVPEVGVYRIKLELREGEGLSYADVIGMIDEATPVALVTGQEALVEAALRDVQLSEQQDRDGVPWLLPDMKPSPPVVQPGPPLQGANVEAYRRVNIGLTMSAATTQKLRELCEQYKGVLGGAKGDGTAESPPVNKSGRVIELHLREGATLDDVVARCRRTAPDDALFLEQFALQLEKEGRLRREPNAPASSLALVVNKPDGGKRVVVNFGPLNTQLLSNHYPLPRIDATLARMSAGKFRSTFDLSMCFHQFPLGERSCPLTATWFSPKLLMSWLVAPMGIKTIPAEVQRVMSEDFDNPFTVMYIDDGLQVLQDEAQVIAGAQHMFSVAEAKGWTFNAKKIYIGYEELPMLGKLVGPGTIKVKPEHLAAIREYGLPQTLRQLRRFNGMLTALASHLPAAASTIRVLHGAAGGGGQGAVEWTDEMRQAFDGAIAMLSSAEVVVPFDASRPLLLLTDWSQLGGAGVFAHLSQTEPLHFEVIEAFSHANTSAEQRYAAAEGEISMVRLALKMHPELMCGRRVHWVTDAKTMKGAFEAFRTSTNARIVRTVDELQSVQIVVIDSPGAKHRIADALSRNPKFEAGGDVSVEQLNEDDPIVALVQLVTEGDEMPVLPLHGDVAAEGGPSVPSNAMTSAFDDAVPGDEVDSFRLSQHASLVESNAATRLRWAARVLDDAELGPLRALADRNTPIYLAGGTVSAPHDDRSLAAMIPRYDADGLLYVRVGEAKHWRVVVPVGCVTEVVHALHSGARVDGAGVSHWHGRRVVAIARRWFWWRTMYADIVKWCKDCIPCQRVRLLTSTEPGNLGDSEADRVPVRLSDWMVDTYALENSHFFTALEAFSGLLVTRELPDQTSASAVAAFESMVIQSFGVPQLVWFDGGRETMGQFAAVCVAYGIGTVEGQPYNPRSQSRIERPHRILNEAVSKARAEGSTSTTAVLLARVAHEINVAPSEHTEGLCPHRLMFGVEPTLPYIRFFSPQLLGLRESSPHLPLRVQLHELALGHAALAATRAEDRAKRRAKHESAFARSHGDPFSPGVGEEVWAIIPPIGAGDKLARHLAWSGPWLVDAFDARTGKVDMVYQADKDASYRASVHVRNTRPFSVVRPLDAPHLLDDMVFQSGLVHSVPLGGMSNLPASVQDGLDAAIEAAAKQSAVADDRRRREEEKELKEKERVEALERRAIELAAKEKADAVMAKKVVEERARRVGKARGELQAAKERQEPEEVLEKGQGRVRVRRRNGDESWVAIDKDDRVLQSLIRQFDKADREARLASRSTLHDDDEWLS